MDTSFEKNNKDWIKYQDFDLIVFCCVCVRVCLCVCGSQHLKWIKTFKKSCPINFFDPLQMLTTVVIYLYLSLPVLF